MNKKTGTAVLIAVILVAVFFLYRSGGEILQGRARGPMEGNTIGKTTTSSGNNTNQVAECAGQKEDINIRPPSYDGTYREGDREVVAYTFNTCSKLDSTVTLWGLKFDYTALTSQPFLTSDDKKRLIDHRLVYNDPEFGWIAISGNQQFQTQDSLCDPDCDSAQVMNFGDTGIEIKPGKHEFALMFDVSPATPFDSEASFEVRYNDAVVAYYSETGLDLTDLLKITVVDNRASVMTAE